mgnify:CR=1 FL=1
MLVITQLGVKSSSLVAVVGAAGLAIGLALQGSLANFAGGVLILLIKPFKVGDWIAAQGIEGAVKEISIFNTRILTFGNQEAIVPNGKLSNDVITNYSKEGTIRLDVEIGISYDADIKRARLIMMRVMENHTDVLKEPKPSVVVTELGDSAVMLRMQPWVKPDHYYSVGFAMYEEVKLAFDAEGIGLPYPQRVVHLKKDTK